LAKTIATLKNFWPQVKSVAVVPVGITKYQKNSLLRPYTPSEAKIIIRDVAKRQEEFKRNLNSNFVFLADEFYLLAEEKIPSYDHYEGFPQIENGVGLVRYFWDDFQKAAPKLPQALKNKKKLFFVTGISGGPVLEPIIKRLNEIKNLAVNLIKVSNDFFGRTVTVTGLLTGHDLILGLKEWRKNEEETPEIFISSTMLKYGADVFLDNTKVSQVETRLNCKISVLEPKGESLVTAIRNLG
jgi:putative radical SAM enzyme (TIGR03279 family)